MKFTIFNYQLSKLFLIIIFFTLSNAFAAEELIIEPDAGRGPLLKAIQEAKTTIHLVMYGFTDGEILYALTQAKKKGKKVQVLLEPYPYKAETENNHAIHYLQNAHIDLQTANPDFKLTHQKTFILDNKRAIIMTFNLTRSSFKNERNFALITNNPILVDDIEKVFLADWNRKTIHVNNPALVWSPAESQPKILNFIQSANQSIEMYAQDLTEYKTIGALAQAAREGKTVKVILSKPRSHRPNNKLNYLRRAGVEIHFSQDLIIHAKVIIVDHHCALLGSTNFTYPSMQLNRELSVISQDPHVVSQLVQTFQRDWCIKPLPL